MLTYGALCELAQRHGVTITENVRAFVREVEEEDRRAIPLLAADHKGMRVDYRGLLGQTREGLFKEPALAEMIRQLQDHIAELGRRWYAGDTAVVDELLQLYCIEQDAREAVAHKATIQEPLTVADAAGDAFVLEFERWNAETGALPRGGSWMAEVSDIIKRAAESQHASCPKPVAATASPDARIEELRKGLFEARDALAYAADLLPQRFQAKDHRFFLAAIERANNILSWAKNG